MDGFSDGVYILEATEEEQGWQEQPSRKSKKKKKNPVVVASRASKRIPRDGVSIAEKASVRAIAKNNTSGMTNPFTVLNSATPSLLQSIIADMNIEGGCGRAD